MSLKTQDIVYSLQIHRKVGYLLLSQPRVGFATHRPHVNIITHGKVSCPCILGSAKGKTVTVLTNYYQDASNALSLIVWFCFSHTLFVKALRRFPLRETP